MPETRPTKPCASCGRSIQWRKKWARDWDQVRYCSDACRRARPDADDARLEATLLDLLRSRPRRSSLCPSEAARAAAAGLAPPGATPDWRPLMEPVRRAARRLAARGLVEFTQQGRTVDPSTARGPVRLRLQG